MNTSARNLVRLTIEPPARGRIRRPTAAAPPRILRWFFRDREVNVHQLTLSIADPDTAIAELRPAP